MDIYIKPTKKASIAKRQLVLLKDIAEVVCPINIEQQLKNIEIFKIEDVDKGSFLISIVDIVKKINLRFPDYTVNNLGEMETLVDYRREKSKDNALYKYLKIVFVSIVLMSGSATAIMSFHSDSQMPQVFEKYHQIFFGQATEHPWVIDISYSIGLAFGIILFFNHFGGKKITEDPTPIEVEMSTYETSVTDTVLDILNTQRIREKDGDSHKKSH